MKRNILLLILILLSVGQVFAQEIIKETYSYASKGDVSLQLDKYAVNDTLSNKPCIIFMFGGGFVNGERDSERYLPYFHSLAQNGNVVVSIDYRRYLRDLDLQSIAGGTKNDFLKLLYRTISTATEDLIDATNFVLTHAEDWNIDKTKIVASGSSAGAIAALHGEYATANRQAIAQPLPGDFRYAGVISFAGAIFSLDGALNWDAKPSPMLLFHGNADQNVPYNVVEMESVGFYGSKFIVNQLNEFGVAYHFYDEEFGAHELADTPMQSHLELVNAFIKREIVEQKGFQLHTHSKKIGRAAIHIDFTIEDYMLKNYAPH